ncbi:hypothetical protein [Sulfurimonas sp. HSL-1716]|uniref:hypothetical protein n=1 Tax=Hydrocurvibacter sulfurireducens TaxID=3131937 RepID=UPI0031F931CB
MSNVKRGLFFGALFAFLVMGVVAMKQAMPEAKNPHMYKELKVYMPYTLEKTIGGLSIIDKRDGSKESPSAADVMLRLDELEKNWGKKHLKVVDNDVVILNDANQSVAKIFIKDKKERAFLKRFFGI